MELPSAKLLIGLPVYNGEDFIETAITSILSQSFKDLVVLVGDNCSTDRTREICERLRSEDERVVYCRHEENLGMAGNFNFVRKMQGFEYFKWMAHDDVLMPGYLSECIKLLDQNKKLALANSLVQRIDAEGARTGDYKDLGLSSSSPSERFWRSLWTVNIYEIYSIFRVSVMKDIPPVSTYFGAERNVLSAALLEGDIGYVQEYLFCRRDHENTLTESHQRAKDENNFSEMQAMHSTKEKVGQIEGGRKKLGDYLDLIGRSKISFIQKILSIKHALHWAFVRFVEVKWGTEDAYRRKLYEKLDLRA